MSEFHSSPPTGDQNPQHPGVDAGGNPPPSNGTWPPTQGTAPSQPLYPQQQPYLGTAPSQPVYPQQPPPGGPPPAQLYYPQWPPTQAAAPSLPLYSQQPYAGVAPSRPLYPQQPPSGGPLPSQPLYPQQPYMGSAPSQPLYAQQPPAGYAAYAGSGASVPPQYVRTNLGEYWKNAKNGKRNLSVLVAVTLLFFLCGGLSTAAQGGSTNANSAAYSTTGQSSTSASGQSNGQSNGQSAAPAQPTDTPEPTDTPAPTATPVPTESPVQYKSSATSVTVADMAKDPNSYKGKTLHFSAVIANFVQDSSGNTAGANVSDPNDYSSFVQIQFTPKFSVAKVNKGDTIEVWGQGMGAFTGTNAYGGQVTEGAIQEVYLYDSTTGYSDTTVSDPSSYTANSSN